MVSQTNGVAVEARSEARISSQVQALSLWSKRRRKRKMNTGGTVLNNSRSSFILGYNQITPSYYEVLSLITLFQELTPSVWLTALENT